VVRFVRRALLLVVLLGIGSAVWLWVPGMRPAGISGVGLGTEPSPEVADATESRILALLQGESSTLELSAVELESLLRHRVLSAWPEGLGDPDILLSEGEMQLGVRVPRSWFPALPELERVVAFLPDTVALKLRGRVESPSTGGAVLRVDGMEAASIPIPRRFFPLLLREVRALLPLSAEEDPEVVPIPLPAGVKSAELAGDKLVLRRVE
jgi:hypothetical protein